MTDEPELAPGDIVQIDPSSDIGKEWGPQLCVVTGLKVWGVQAYFLHAAGRGDFGPAYVRLARESFERVGRVAWWAPPGGMEDAP